MIGAFTRLSLFLGLVAALGLLGAWLTGLSGAFRLEGFGYELSLSPAVAALALVFLTFGFWLFFLTLRFLRALWHFLRGDETAFSRFRRRGRERRGFEALSASLLALTSGDGKTALVQLRRAELALNRPELTLPVQAQAAELAGESAAAEAAYRAMLSHGPSRHLGLKGLARQKWAAGEGAAALALAEKALALKPGERGLQEAVFAMQLKQEDWAGARGTLAALKKAGHLPRDLWQRRDGVLALALSQQKAAAGQDHAAEEAALEAGRACPSFPPAAAAAGQALAARGDLKGAAKLLTKAYGAAPHPDIARAFAELQPEESPEARLKRFQPLLKAAPAAEETQLLATDLLIVTDDFAAARRALGDLPETAPSQRALALQAAIARGEGASEMAVLGVMAAAMRAPRGPLWCCAACEAIHTAWAPLCRHCGAFDTLAWRRPLETAGPSPLESEIRPQIIAAARETH